VPQARVIALLVNPNTRFAENYIRNAQEAARAKGVQLRVLNAGTESEIDAAFATLIQLQVGALLIRGDAFYNAPASSSWRWHPAMPSRRSMSGPSSPQQAA